MKRESKKNIAINIGFFFLFLLDRLFKWLAINYLAERNPITFFNFFRLEFYLNKGIIFSIALPKVLIFIFTITILIVVVYFLYIGYRKKDYRLIIPLKLIFIGALSNLLDRIYHGAIIDFVNLRVLPVFNLADCMIFAGVIALIIKFNRINKDEKIH